MKTDFVAQFVALARETASIDDRAAREIETRLRAEHGGRTVRIAEMAPLTAEFVDARLRDRKSVREIAAEVSVSRATIYRMLSANSFKRRKS